MGPVALETVVSKARPGIAELCWTGCGSLVLSYYLHHHDNIFIMYIGIKWNSTAPLCDVLSFISVFVLFVDILYVLFVNVLFLLISGVIFTVIVTIIIIDVDKEDLETDVELLGFLIDVNHHVLGLVPDTFASNKASLTPLFLRRLYFKMSTILLIIGLI